MDKKVDKNEKENSTNPIDETQYLLSTITNKRRLKASIKQMEINKILPFSLDS